MKSRLTSTPIYTEDREREREGRKKETSSFPVKLEIFKFLITNAPPNTEERLVRADGILLLACSDCDEIGSA